MNRYDGGAAVVLGAYFIAATYGGKWPKLRDLLIRDREFFAWFVALVILGFLRTRKEIKGPIEMLITASFIGLVLLNIGTLSKEVKTTWEFLKGGEL